MTRDERLAEEERKRTERLRKARERLSATKRARRDEADKRLATRRKQTGLDAEEAGLFVWDEGTVRQLFALLGTKLAEVADPVAVLDALLSDPVSQV